MQSRLAQTTDLVKRAHAQALEHVFDAVVITDLEGRVVGWNPGSERLYGYTREEIIGRSVDRLHCPEDRAHILAEVMASVEATGRWYGEVGLLRKDGSRGWIESSVVIVHDAEGQPVGALGVNRDITDRVRAERALAESEVRFRSLVENALVGIYLIRAATFLYVNPTFERIFGYSATELASVRVMDLVAAEDRVLMEANIRRRLEGEALEESYTFRGVRRDGRVFDVETYGAGIQWEGEPAIIGMLLDVSHRTEAERRLRESEQRHRQIVDELFERVTREITSREQLRTQFLQVQNEAGSVRVEPDDQRFLDGVREAICRHLGDEAYTVAQLASDVAQSRSQLHRRLRRLVNESPSQTIKRIRLEEAGRRLRQVDARIADIAYGVGFKSVSHFSTSFKAQFGVSPSVYRDRE